MEFDRLVMKIETDGSISVRAAVEEGLEILRRFFEHLVSNLEGRQREILNKIIVEESVLETTESIKEQ